MVSKPDGAGKKRRQPRPRKGLVLHHLPTARALTVKIAGNRAAPPVRRCLGIIGSWAPGITRTEATPDQGGHDHSHDDGLWARVKHAVVPHSHDARTSGHAPFARILVSAEASELPGQLVDQLATDGVMVVPVAGEMLRVVAHPEGPRVTRHGRYRFVPLIP